VETDQLSNQFATSMPSLASIQQFPRRDRLQLLRRKIALLANSNILLRTIFAFAIIALAYLIASTQLLSFNNIKFSQSTGKLEVLLSKVPPQWSEADQETLNIMLERRVKKKSIKYLQKDDISNFPCEILKPINQIWHEKSGGSFSFASQRNIYLDLESDSRNEPQENIYEKFYKKVGWKNSQTNILLRYSEILRKVDSKKSDQVEEMKGMLPLPRHNDDTMSKPSGMNKEEFSALLSRLKECNI
jgi:hypothetical protein